MINPYITVGMCDSPPDTCFRAVQELKYEDLQGEVAAHPVLYLLLHPATDSQSLVSPSVDIGLTLARAHNLW